MKQRLEDWFKMKSVYSKNLQSSFEVKVLYLVRDNSDDHFIRSLGRDNSLVIFAIETMFFVEKKPDIFILKIHIIKKTFTVQHGCYSPKQLLTQTLSLSSSPILILL